jgi:aldehyde dehydrogenase (NAD+)
MQIKFDPNKIYSGVSLKLIGNHEATFSEASTTLVSINPTTEQIISKIAICTPEEYEKIISLSVTAFESWQQVPAPKRAELVRCIGELLRENKAKLGHLVSLEMGKSLQEGEGEVQEMIDMADFAVGLSRMLYGKTMPSERPNHRMMEQWHPYGVVGVMSAFNFPVAVWAWNAFLAVICGNTVVWKPSSKTPLCARAVQDICDQAMSALGYEHILSLFISNNHDLADRFLQDTRVPLISFTGSTQTGRHVAKKVAERFGRVILELGGNNAVIVDETADLNLAIPAIVFGAVGTAGQRCTSTRRLIIHQSLEKKIINKLVHAYEQIKIGDPLDPHNHMGPLIDKKAVDNYLNTIKICEDLGGKLLFGGKRLSQAGYFVQPALIQAQSHWPILNQETFAPILYIMTFNTLSEAIKINNQVPQGLSSALFTNDFRHSEQFLASLGSDCGIANINIGTSGAEIGGAFGGEKETGGGREAGSDCWKAYMRRQTNTLNWGTTLPLAQGLKFTL